MQRQNATARCAKSRHTPFRSLKRFPRRPGRARVLVAERDVLMDVVADRLNRGPSPVALPNRSRRCPRAGRSRSIGCRAETRRHSSGRSCTACCCSEARSASGCPSRSRWRRRTAASRPAGATIRRAPVAEDVPVERRSGPTGSVIRSIRDDDVAGPRVVDVQHQHHRRRLRDNRRSVRSRLVVALLRL